MATEDANIVATTATSLVTMTSLVTPTTKSVTVSMPDQPIDDLTTVSASITQAKLLQTAEAKIQDTGTTNVSGKRRCANKHTNTDEATRNICVRFEGNQ